MKNEILLGDCLEVLKTLESESVDCCVTSPPYWGLRDYGNENQLGLEKTPQEFISKLTEIFNEVRRVLKQEGTLWLNLGDTYSSHKDCKSTSQSIAKGTNSEQAHEISKGKSNSRNTKLFKQVGLKNKDLVGIPWMAAFALRESGWYLRQDIIWNKPNPMPESVTDRCTKSHEYIFLLSKSAKYYYDHESIKKPLAENSLARLNQDIENQKETDRKPNHGKMKAVIGGKKHKHLDYNGQNNHSFHKTRNQKGEEWESKDGKANKKSVWTVTTKGFKEAHFATYPELLIVDCIKAGCPEDGIVLDPFMGAGTTALVARKLNRNYIGIELNPDYIQIAENRIYNQLGMFK